MKTTPARHLLVAASTLVLATLPSITAPSAHAQAAPGGIAPPSPPAPGLPGASPLPPVPSHAARAASEQPEKRTSFHLNEAALSEAVEILEKEFGDANIIVPTSLANIRVSVRLRSVTLDQALRAITIATEGQVQFNQEDQGLYSATPGMAMAEGKRAMCRVFSLAEYLGGKEKEEAQKAMQDVHEALATAMKLLQVANAGYSNQLPRLELHESTKLLIVVGTAEQLDLVSQVVSALQGGSPAARGGFGGPTFRGMPGGLPGDGNPYSAPQKPGSIPPRPF